jgi:hypothetical protein
LGRATLTEQFRKAQGKTHNGQSRNQIPHFAQFFALFAPFLASLRALFHSIQRTTGKLKTILRSFAVDACCGNYRFC